MTVYLHDFRFRSGGEEDGMVDREKGTCIRTRWRAQ